MRKNRGFAKVIFGIIDYPDNRFREKNGIIVATVKKII